MKYNVHDVWEKVVAYNTRKLKKMKNWSFGYDLKLRSFSKETLNMQGIFIFKKKSYLFNND
jgi:hypothetical protein